MYQWKSRDFRGVKLLEGRSPDTDDNGDALEHEERAIIGDPRNDENIIVSQLQLASCVCTTRLWTWSGSAPRA